MSAYSSSNASARVCGWLEDWRKRERLAGGLEKERLAGGLEKERERLAGGLEKERILTRTLSDHFETILNE